MDWLKIAFYVVLFIAAVVAAAVAAILTRLRRFEIKKLARQLGYTYRGGLVPEAVCVFETAVAHPTSTRNVIDRDAKDVRVVAYDCEVGWGETSWKRTVIAVRSRKGAVDANKLFPELHAEHAAEWTILYAPKDVKAAAWMPVKDLEAMLRRLES